MTVTTEQLDDFLGYAQQVVDADYGVFAKGFTNPTPPILLLGCVTGKTKYARIYIDTGHQRMVWGFVCLVDNDVLSPRRLTVLNPGDVLKANGWKAPAVNFARGNIYGPDHGLSGARWTGIG